MKYTALLLSLLIAGCSHNEVVKEPPITVTKYKYIVLTQPAETVSIPAPLVTPDPITSTDAEIATWMVDIRARVKTLEDKLNSIGNYQSKALDSIKKTKNIKDEDIIKND